MKPLLLSFFFSFFLITNAQIAAPKIDRPNPLEARKIDLNNVKGSPYENEEYTQGKLIDEVTNQEKNCFFRYNAFTDEVEIKNDNKTETESMLKSKGIYILSEGKEYRYNNYVTTDNQLFNQISICLLKEKPFSIHKYVIKEFVPEKKAQTSLEQDKPARLRTKDYYFIERNGTLIPIEIHKKTLVKSIPSHQKEVEKFIKSNKLKLKSEADLVKVITYYNSLL